MKTTEIMNAGGTSVKYDIVNIGCKDCPYCMMAEGHYLCRSDKSCNAKANMTDDDEPKQKVIIYIGAAGKNNQRMVELSQSESYSRSEGGRCIGQGIL